MFGWIKSLAVRKKYREEIEEMNKKRQELDKRVKILEVATINGDPHWMLGMIRRDPSCAVKVFRECDNEHNH